MSESIFRCLLTLSILSILLNNSGCVVPYNDVKSDYETLLSAYSTASAVGITDVLPKDLDEGPIDVLVGIDLYAIMDYDAVSGKIQLVASMKMEWLDEVNTLTGTTFIGSLPTIFVSYDQIWTPDIVLMSAVDSVERIGDETYRVRYNVSSGYCKWYPRMIINAACTPDMTYYPFDKQTCTLTVTPWNRGTAELRLVPLTNEWGTTNLEKSGTWGIAETSTESYIGSNNTRYHVDFKITIKRKPLFLALVIVLPVLLLSLLTGFLFLLPPGSGSRVGFGITCFLSFVVLLQTLMSFMPEVSSPMSILCFYVIFMLSFSVLLSIANVFLLRMYLNPGKEEVPRGFLILLEVITCKFWRRCPKCPKIECLQLKKIWQHCPRFPRFGKRHGFMETEMTKYKGDIVHNVRFTLGLTPIRETSIIQRPSTRLTSSFVKESDTHDGDVDTQGDVDARVIERQHTESAMFSIEKPDIDTTNICDENKETDQSLDLYDTGSSYLKNFESIPNPTTNSTSGSGSSGYLSESSSQNHQDAGSPLPLTLESKQKTEVDIPVQSESESGIKSNADSTMELTPGSEIKPDTDSPMASRLGSRMKNTADLPVSSVSAPVIILEKVPSVSGSMTIINDADLSIPSTSGTVIKSETDHLVMSRSLSGIKSEASLPVPSTSGLGMKPDAGSLVSSRSGSGINTEAYLPALSTSGTVNKSDTGTLMSTRFGSGILSETDSSMPSTSESRNRSDADSRNHSAASSRTSSTPDSKTEVTWAYIAQVLDLFFLAVFCIVQTIFTIFFLVPLGAQY